MRNEIWQFLSAIKAWMFENIGGSSMIGGQELFTSLKELSLKYHPFDNTAEDWKGCKGSKPHYRGYPCGLWQLLHTLAVNAAKDDSNNPFNGLSSTIVDYIQNFFTCRHCAKKF